MARQRKTQSPAIEFICQYCGNEMTAEGSKAGAKGRCPKCRMVITIPNASMNVPEEFDPTSVFHNKKLSHLYSQFAERHEDVILIQAPFRHVENGTPIDILGLVIETGFMRKQIVCIGAIKYNSPPFVGKLNETVGWIDVHFSSSVGCISDYADTTPISILSLMHHGRVTASINEDYTLFIGAKRKLDTLDYGEFELLIFETARIADKLEELLTGKDNH